MDPIIEEFKQKGVQIINHLKEDLKSIRTGRANPSLVENILVETYGGQTTLKLLELATITTEGPTTLIIVPFDPSTFQDIEKAIQKSTLGLNPAAQGNRLVVKLPQLTEEQRQKMTRLVGTVVEDKRGAVRNARDDARRVIKHQLEKKEISEDDKFRLEKQIDEEAHKLTQDTEAIKENKENEIMQI